MTIYGGRYAEDLVLGTPLERGYSDGRLAKVYEESTNVDLLEFENGWLNPLLLI